MPELVDCNMPGRNETYVSGSSIRTKKLILPDANIQNFQSGIRRLSIKCLPESVRKYVEEQIKLCCPDEVHVCDGSDKENCRLLEKLQKDETIVPLPKYNNCWLAKTDPRDVARVESKTFICTPERCQAIPETKSGVKGSLGHWISPEDMETAVEERFPGCMKDKTMYVIPFSMGPLGSQFSKIGVQLTDSPYVVAAMRIMTRMGSPVLDHLQAHANETVVKCLHSVGQKSNPEYPGWQCDPERTIILHKPLCNEIVSYGSGYGGNSLLGKKCLALRLGSWMAKEEGWLAEHMLILGITPPCGQKKYIAAAFPSACGKTNLALMTPSLPGYKIECVGDDIAWLRYNSKTKMLHAVNPEYGFFGVAPGTSHSTNPNAMETMQENSIFTNVASTSDGGVWWEGLEDVSKGVCITDWLGNPWTKESKTPAAHPNSRFCCPASQCPIIDPRWEDPEGVPISAILFGGRRPEGVPLVYEAFNWRHGVFVGSAMRSEATAAAEHKGKTVMHDPFAMRPFFGYNFGHYLQHWLSMEQTEGINLPKIFHVNWFRKNKEGKFLWPGYGENIRVLDWVLNRVNCKDGTAEETPIGYVPAEGSLNLNGLKDVNMKELLSVPKEFWNKEIEEITKYYSEQLPHDLPDEIKTELKELKNRICSN